MQIFVLRMFDFGRSGSMGLRTTLTNLQLEYSESSSLTVVLIFRKKTEVNAFTTVIR